jgi:hypothetical protein
MTSRSRTDGRSLSALRVALWGAVGLQAVLLTARFAFELQLAGDGSDPSHGIEVAVAELIAMAAFPAVGVVILRRRPTSVVGWLFCVVNIGLVSNTTVRAYAHLGLAEPGSVPVPEAVVWLYTWPGFVSFAFYVLLLLLFPDGRFPSPSWRVVGRVTVACMLVAALLAATAPGRIDQSLGLALDNPFGVGGTGLGSLHYEASTLGYPIGLLLILAGLGSVAQRYRRSVGIERLQIKWFATAAIVWAVLLAAFLAVAFRYPSWDFPLWARGVEVTAHLGAALFPVAAGVAILRYRLYDIDRIISRTLSYGLLTAVLVGVYAAGVVGLGGLLRSLGGGSGDLVVAASTLAVAALFGPARRRIQSLVDRRFNRARYDGRQIVEEFTQWLRDEVDLTTVRDALASTADAAMQPRTVGVWLPPEREVVR